MKKIVLTAIGFAFTLSILSSNHFSASALNKGDGGAPARPDLAYGDYPISYAHDDGGGISQQETHADHF
ncbi:hypothetical protein [Bacillus multifaciens]|uniref:hypothetical protein n=1 Tax=Bacillus multifaciens TaxID=3068506 RepID=UPI0027404950|nr:hypothetical protein [Bacillus sp. WLY-B-L8]MDP7979555.1 hypothetical protein [Bacillus sp. WLY-B-L8]